MKNAPQDTCQKHKGMRNFKSQEHRQTIKNLKRGFSGISKNRCAFCSFEKGFEAGWKEAIKLLQNNSPGSEV